MRPIPFRAKFAVVLAALATALANPVFSSDQSSESPLELVRRTVQNELAVSSGGAKVMFMDRKETPHGSESKLMIETRDGIAGLVVANNDNPLTAEQRQAEEARLTRLVGNPQGLGKKQKSEKDDAERIARIIKALPDAFVYETDGTAAPSQEVGRAGDPLVRLKFRPNAKYNPPSHVEQVLTGLQGYLLIDANEHRIAKIDGTLTKEVSFGWGILGHLDRGGRFLVEQAEVIQGGWEITHMNLAFTGKELLFKHFSIKSDEVFSRFRAAPQNLSFAQGVELLKKQEAELAENRQQPGINNPK
jgi:hypothetical protein